MTETPQNAEAINIPQFINELFFEHCDQFFSRNAQVCGRKENEVLFLMPVTILFQHRSLSSLPRRAVLDAVKNHPRLYFLPAQDDLDEIEKECMRYSIEIRMPTTEKLTFMAKVDCEQDTTVEQLKDELAKLALSASTVEESQSKRDFFVYFDSRKDADEAQLKMASPFTVTLLTSPPPTLASFSKYRHTYNTSTLNNGTKGPSNIFYPGHSQQTQTQTQQMPLHQNALIPNQQSQNQPQPQPQLQSQPYPPNFTLPQHLMYVPGTYYPGRGYCYLTPGTQPNAPAQVTFSMRPFFSSQNAQNQQMHFGQQYSQGQKQNFGQNYNQSNYRQNRQNQNQSQNQNQTQTQTQTQQGNTNQNGYNRKKGKGNMRFKNKRNGNGNYTNANASIGNNTSNRRENGPRPQNQRSVEANSGSYPPLSHDQNVGSGYEFSSAVKQYSIAELQKIVMETVANANTADSPKPELLLMPDAHCVAQTPINSLFAEPLTEQKDLLSTSGNSTVKAKTGASYADILRANSPSKSANAAALTSIPLSEVSDYKGNAKIIRKPTSDSE